MPAYHLMGACQVTWHVPEKYELTCSSAVVVSPAAGAGALPGLRTACSNVVYTSKSGLRSAGARASSWSISPRSRVGSGSRLPDDTPRLACPMRRASAQNGESAPGPAAGDKAADVRELGWGVVWFGGLL